MKISAAIGTAGEAASCETLEACRRAVVPTDISESVVTRVWSVQWAVQGSQPSQQMRVCIASTRTVVVVLSVAVWAAVEFEVALWRLVVRP